MSDEVIKVFHDSRNNYDYWKIYTEYNIQVNSGKINRAEEFLTNYGDGDIEKGIEKLRSDIENWSLGGNYIQGLFRNKNEILIDEEKVQKKIDKYLDYLSEELNKK